MMTRRTTSIKGETVDFDLFEVKRQISEKPQSKESKDREKFVYSKRRRGSKKAITKMMDDQRANAENVKKLLDAQKSSDSSGSDTTGKVNPSGDAPPTKKKVETKTPRRIIKKNKD